MHTDILEKVKGGSNSSSRWKVAFLFRGWARKNNNLVANLK
jgi:hypothetical protein